MEILFESSLQLSLKISWNLGKVSETRQARAYSKLLKYFETART